VKSAEAGKGDRLGKAMKLESFLDEDSWKQREAMKLERFLDDGSG
jgi:hypothetical protein